MTCTAIRHGTENAYRHYGCRCPSAYAVARRRGRNAQARRRHLGMPLVVDPTGSMRRLRALNRIGWPTTLIAERLGVSLSPLRKLARGQVGFVRRSNAEALAVLYDELCTEDGPDVRSTLGKARAKGWHGPEAWTDETIDDPDGQPLTEVADWVAVGLAVNGDSSFRLAKPDRLPFARAALASGWAISTVARRLGINNADLKELLAKAEDLSDAS